MSSEDDLPVSMANVAIVESPTSDEAIERQKDVVRRTAKNIRKLTSQMIETTNSEVKKLEKKHDLEWNRQVSELEANHEYNWQRGHKDLKTKSTPEYQRKYIELGKEYLSRWNDILRELECQSRPDWEEEKQEVLDKQLELQLPLREKKAKYKSELNNEVQTLEKLFSSHETRRGNPTEETATEAKPEFTKSILLLGEEINEIILDSLLEHCSSMATAVASWELDLVLSLKDCLEQKEDATGQHYKDGQHGQEQRERVEEFLKLEEQKEAQYEETKT